MRALLLLAIAVAFVPTQSAMAEMSWYIGGGGSFTTLESKGFAAQSGLESELPPETAVSSFTLTSAQLKDSPLGWQVFGGLMFSKNFGVAIKYFDSGKAEDTWDATLTETFLPPPSPPPDPNVTPLTYSGELNIEGFTAYFVQTVPVSNSVDFSFQIGVTFQDLNFDWVETSASGLLSPNGSISRDDTGFAAAGVVRYRFWRNFAVSAELEYNSADFDGLIAKPLRFNLNGEIHF